MTLPATIPPEIHIEYGDGFTVRVGEHYADRLTFDECLGLVAILMAPRQAGLGPLCWLKTQEEHYAYQMRRLSKKAALSQHPEHLQEAVEKQ